MPARVQVGGGAAHGDVDGEHAARGDVQRRLLGRPHRPVGRHGHVGPKHSRLAASAASRLGLPISSSPSSRIERSRAGGRAPPAGVRPRRARRAWGPCRRSSRGRTSARHDRRLERRRLPRAHLARRLHVVVGVDEHRRRALGAEPLPEHERVPAGRDDTAAERPKPRREPRRRAPDVVPRGRGRRSRWGSQPAPRGPRRSPPRAHQELAHLLDAGLPDGLPVGLRPLVGPAVRPVAEELAHPLGSRPSGARARRPSAFARMATRRRAGASTGSSRATTRGSRRHRSTGRPPTSAGRSTSCGRRPGSRDGRP